MNQDFNELKQQATEYYENNHVPERIEDILNRMFFENPKDIYGRLSEYFETFALNPVVAKLHGKAVITGSGSPGLQCSVCAVVKNKDKFLSSSQLSLNNEMKNIHEQIYSENEVAPSIEEIIKKSCSNIDEEISIKMKGTPLLNQLEIDKVLSDWIDEMEFHDISKDNVGDENEQNYSNTPTPSSGKRKKPASGKGKKKQSDKPIPPKEPVETRLKGCTAVIAASLAVLKASSTFLGVPAFVHLHNTMKRGEICRKMLKDVAEITMPTPAMTIITGGKTAPGKLSILSNLFVIAKPGWGMEESVTNLTKIYQTIGKNMGGKSNAGVVTSPSGGYQASYDKLEQPLDVVLDGINASGFAPGDDVFIGMEFEAGENFDYDKGKYEVAVGLLKTADEMVDFYRDVVTRYPAVIMLINPIRKEDREQWPKICEAISEKCFVIGGEAIYGPLHTINSNTLFARKSSGLAINTGSRVTCSDLSRLVEDAHANEGVTIMISPSGDACDDVYTDVAVGLGVDIVRFGAPSRGENVSRLNKLSEIEEFVKQDETMRIEYKKSFSFPVIKLPPVEPQSDDEHDVTQGSPDQKPKKK